MWWSTYIKTLGNLIFHTLEENYKSLTLVNTRKLRNNSLFIRLLNNCLHCDKTPRSHEVEKLPTILIYTTLGSHANQVKKPPITALVTVGDNRWKLLHAFLFSTLLRSHWKSVETTKNLKQVNSNKVMTIFYSTLSVTGRTTHRLSTKAKCHLHGRILATAK